MEASELRIGNYVYDRADKVLIIDWWENINKVCMDMGKYNSGIGMMDRHPLTENAEYCKPIPLTEQWLLDFGFKEIEHKKFDKTDIVFYKINNDSITRHLNFVDEKISYCFFLNYDKEIELKYVHQLQNLYFALTGEELKIKTTSSTSQ